MNRVLWTIIGAVLLAAGVLGLLAGFGTLSFVDKQQAVLTQDMVDAWNERRIPALAVTIAVGVLLALLGILLLRSVLRRRGGASIEDMHFEHPAAGEPTLVHGSTEVASKALHDALEEDLEGDRQVRRAAVRLTGSADHPQLLVRLAVTEDADIGRLAGHLDRAVDRFTITSGVRPEVSDVVVRMPWRTSSGPNSRPSSLSAARRARDERPATPQGQATSPGR